MAPIHGCDSADRTVDFYTDAELACRTDDKIAPSESGQYLVIGNRSHRIYGPALIDTIRVYSEETVEYLTRETRAPDL
jgi:hypothetical protein